MKMLLSLAAAAMAALLAPSPAAAEAAAISFTVDRSERKVYVRRGGETIRVHDVAVGKAGHATPLGSWEFHQVDINPDWTPPDSDWARDSSWTAPGAPDNPMGRARLIFNRPYTIHGTDAHDSLGKAASHGSIRIANEHAIELAELLLREGGAWQGRDWFQAMIDRPTEMFEIPLERRIPIEVVE